MAQAVTSGSSSRTRLRATDGSSSSEILNLLQGNVPDVVTSRAYAIGQVLNAIVMVLLPLIYGAMILTAAILTVKWFTGMREMLSVPGSIVLPMLYFTPGIIGIVIVLFMIKPIFARGEKGSEPVRLRREDEPLLYAYVERLCDLLEAPRPQWIEVDLNVNAAAAPAHGILGVARGQVKLVLGLPLIAGTSLHQFTGIVAHELGHFTQGGSMMCSIYVRLINHWFTRVVYERDAWDRHIERLTRATPSFLRWILHLARFGIWLNRRVLRVLLVLGDLLCSYTMRQAEYDADEFQIGVEGSDAFSRTHHAISLLSMAEDSARDMIQSGWESGRLGDNLPVLVAARAQQIPQDAREKLIRLMLTQRTGPFDSHPSMADRIAAAKARNYPGIVHDDRPAEALFANFGEVCRKTSISFLREALGEQFDAGRLVPSTALLAEAKQAREAEKSLMRFYHGRKVLVDRLVYPDRAACRPPNDAAATLRSLIDARKAMLGAGSLDNTAAEHWTDLSEKLQLAVCVHVFARAGAPITNTELGLSQASSAQVAALIEQLTAERDDLEVALSGQEDLFRERLSRGIQVLWVEQFDKRMKPGERLRLQSRARKLMEAGEKLEACRSDVAQLTRRFRIVLMLLEDMDVTLRVPSLNETYHANCGESATMTATLARQLGSLRYPFEHHESGMSIGKYLLPEPPNPQSPIEVVQATSRLIERYEGLLMRVGAELAMIAETVETAAGFKPMADKKEPDRLGELLTELETELAKPQTLVARARSVIPWFTFAGSAVAMIVLFIGVVWLMMLVLSLGNGGSGSNPRNWRPPAQGTRYDPQIVRHDAPSNVEQPPPPPATNAVPAPAGVSASLNDILADLDVPSLSLRRAALANLAMMPVQEQRRGEVLRRVESILVGNDQPLRAGACRVLAVWGNDRSVQILRSFLRSGRAGEDQAEVENAIRQLEAPLGMPAEPATGAHNPTASADPGGEAPTRKIPSVQTPTRSRPRPSSSAQPSGSQPLTAAEVDAQLETLNSANLFDRLTALERLRLAPVLPERQVIVARKLEGMIEDKNPMHVRNVIRTMEVWGDRQTVDFMLAAVARPSTDMHTRMNMFQAIIKLGDESNLKTLETLAASKDPVIASQARNTHFSLLMRLNKANR